MSETFSYLTMFRPYGVPLIWITYFNRLWRDLCLLVAGVGAGCWSDFLLAQCWIWWAYNLWKLQQISQQLWKVSELIIIFEYFTEYWLLLSFRITRWITLLHQIVLSWDFRSNLLHVRSTFFSFFCWTSLVLLGLPFPLWLWPHNVITPFRFFA